MQGTFFLVYHALTCYTEWDKARHCRAFSETLDGSVSAERCVENGNCN